MQPDALSERLRSFREAGAQDVAPLWIEVLPAGQALEELKIREGAVFRLQEARFLRDVGRHHEATEVLESIEALPEGFRGVLQALRAPNGVADPTVGRTAERVDDLETPASPTLAELYATQGEVGAALAVYEKLLAAAPGNESLKERVEALRGRVTHLRTSSEEGEAVSTSEVGQSSPAELLLRGWLERVRGWRRSTSVPNGGPRRGEAS